MKMSLIYKDDWEETKELIKKAEKWSKV